MPRTTFAEIEAARAHRGQKPLADIVTDRLTDSPTERRRKRRILRLHKKLHELLGDDHGVFLEVERLGTERLIELEKIAVEVGMSLGMQLGHQDPPLPPELKDVVEDLAAVCADHEGRGIDVDVALACVLRARLLTVERLRSTGDNGK